MTRPFAEVIGDPIAHSKSPLIHNFWLSRLNLEADYGRAHVRSDELADYFTERRLDPLWRGCNVTIPHKEAVIPLLDAVDFKAAAIGAVNTIYRGPQGELRGTNTDVDGVAEAVAGTDLAGQVAVVIGAGGAARAAFAFLAGQPSREVRVLARNAEKAAAALAGSGLKAEILPFDADYKPCQQAALVINATQLGMTGQQPMPEFILNDLSGMNPGGVVFDMVYAPLETALLQRAVRAGQVPADGLTMLVGQAATAFAKFFGVKPDRSGDAELRKALLG